MQSGAQFSYELVFIFVWGRLAMQSIIYWDRNDNTEKYQLIEEILRERSCVRLRCHVKNGITQGSDQTAGEGAARGRLKWPTRVMIETVTVLIQYT